MEETRVLSTVISARSDGTRDFLPLTGIFAFSLVMVNGFFFLVVGQVDYQDKRFAQLLTPNTFMRREGAGRLIDRSIRPLFPAEFYHDIQMFAVNATSAALTSSDIPWGGPIGVIRLGRNCGKLIVNPTIDELTLSDLNLVYACTRDRTLMMDVQALGISENDLKDALRVAHTEEVKCLEPQRRLAHKAGKEKHEYKLSMVSEETYEKIRSLSEAPIEALFTNSAYGKFERGEALDSITLDVKKKLEEECDDEGLKFLSKTLSTVRKKLVCKRILIEGLRADGRRPDEVRSLICRVGNLPVLDGSSLFNLGDTHVLCTTTIESLRGPPSKQFMLHHSFPPFCINEVGERVGLNRSEVGHEVITCDGSTSMASVCAGSMAMMNAGVPLSGHVAGVSMGLISDTDPPTVEITDYQLLTDILGSEDHLVDMGLKIAGTRNGITTIQLDTKTAGIRLDIVCECLETANKALFQILDNMEREISSPRSVLMKTTNNTPTPTTATW
ncbi:hypothetical protein BUALT_Bualt04G0161400 [Buddleja alternifolia]|uniref:Uncharacterized protein n=1 Tax=Buddleja alternifolia TaxID=168488 RepID=A0AAV6XPD3_9LAMI|nr:hypothetical protein BUALT_Bualt04G0161400 [Buddleja alternifolia]